MMHRTLAVFVILILLLHFVAALEAQTPAGAKPQPAPPAKRPRVAPATPGGVLGPAELTRRVEQALRRLYAWGAEYKLELGPPAPTEISYFFVVPVAITRGTQRQQEVVSISADGKYLLLGQIVNLARDPFADTLKQIDFSARPSKGPSDAAVTLVAYSDFQCPTCKELYRTLKSKIEPKYPRLRIIFKNYPLTQIHPWAMLAALAGRCAYLQSPESFWPLHDLVFESQSNITTENAREKLIALAQQVGLDLVPFNACLTSDEAWQAVRADMEEGKALQVANTPTVFINGRRFIGAQAEPIQQMIEYEISQARQAARTPRPSQN